MTSSNKIPSRLKGNLGWLLANHFISQFIAFAGTIFLARVLGKAGFGQYSLALVIGQCLWIFGDFGINTLGVRLLATESEHDTKLISLLSTIKLIASCTIFTIFLITLLIFPINPSSFWPILWGGLFVLTNSLNSEWVFKGIERTEFIAISNFIVSVLFVLSILLFVKSGSNTTLAIFLRSISFLPGTLLLAFFVKKTLQIKLVFSLHILSKKIIVDAFYQMLSTGMTMVYISILALYLGFFHQPAELGLFNSAYRPIILILVLGAIVPMAFFPLLANCIMHTPDSFPKVYSSLQSLLIVTGLPIGVSCALLAREIITFLYGVQYSDASPLFCIMISIVPLTFVRQGYSQTILASGHQKAYFYATTLGTVIMSLIGLILVPRYNALGAALTFFLGEIVFTLILFFFFKTIFFTPTIDKIFLVKVSTSTIIMTGTIYLLKIHLLLLLPLSLLLYCAILWKLDVFLQISIPFKSTSTDQTL